MTPAEIDRLCPDCTASEFLSLFNKTYLPSETPDEIQRWGLRETRTFGHIQDSQECPLCRLVCESLYQDKRCPPPRREDQIYFYRMLFGDYESRLLGSPIMDESSCWQLHQINRLRVSTNPAILDNVGFEFARFLDCVEQCSP